MAVAQKREFRQYLRSIIGFVATDQNLDDDEVVARALIALVPDGQELLQNLECDGPYGPVVMALGCLAALNIPVPADLVERVKQIWPNEGIDLDDMLYERLGNLTVSKTAAA